MLLRCESLEPPMSQLGHPRPSRCHADDGRSALSYGRPIAARRIGEKCQFRTFEAARCALKANPSAMLGRFFAGCNRQSP